MLLLVYPAVLLKHRDFGGKDLSHRGEVSLSRRVPDNVQSSLWGSERKPKLSCGHWQGKCDVASGGNPLIAQSHRRGDKCG